MDLVSDPHEVQRLRGAAEYAFCSLCGTGIHPVGMTCPGPSETIEQEASRLVRNGKRQGTYGHPRGDFDTIARIWSAILTKSNGFEVKVEAEQVALCMSGLKLSRLARDPHHHDSKVDVIGYMICLDRLDEPT